MSGIQLLDKTRKIGKLLHNSHSSKVVFNDICKVMQDALQSNVLVISRKGKVLGISGKDGGAIRELSGCNVGSFLDPLLNERMLSILSTKENASLATLGFDGEEDEEFSAIVTPIEIAGERLGTLFLYRRGQSYTIDDIILCEYGYHGGGAGNAAGCDRGECGGRPAKIADGTIAALGTLILIPNWKRSALIFQELHGTEGILVASKIADQCGHYPFRYRQCPARNLRAPASSSPGPPA